MSICEEEAAIDRHVGTRVRAFRRYRGWTQGELAARLDISQQQIYKYETGVNRISAGMLYGFSQMLGVRILAFFEGMEDCTRPSTGSGRTVAGGAMDSAGACPREDGGGNDVGEGEAGDHRVAGAPRDDSGVVIASNAKQSRAASGADPYRVIASRADNPNPSIRALKIAMALEAIPNAGLKAAIAGLIAFAAGLPD